MFKVGDRVFIIESAAYPESLWNQEGEILDIEEDRNGDVFYVKLDNPISESAEGDTWYFDYLYLLSAQE